MDDHEEPNTEPHLAQRRHRRLPVLPRLRPGLRGRHHRACRFRAQRRCGRVDHLEDGSPLMIPALLTATIRAALVASCAFTACRAPHAQLLLSWLLGMATAAVLVLFIRLIAPFGGWADWFVWVWLAGMLAIVVAVFRAALVWPDLPWRSEDEKVRQIGRASGRGRG